MNLKEKVLFGVFLIFLNLAAWQKDGVPICTAQGLQWHCKAEPLTAGRVAITWEDGRSDTLSKVYLQVLDSLGNPLFTKDGIRVSQRAGTEVYHQTVTHGSDIFIAWEGAPGRSRINTDIFVTKIDGLTGVKKWGDIPICTADGGQYEPQLCLDGSGGGCYVTWKDYRSGSADIYCARVEETGQVAGERKWDSLSGPNVSNPTVVPSGDGVFIFWSEKRGDTVGIYGNRILGDSLEWGQYGKLVIVDPYLYRFSVFQKEYSPLYAHPDHKGGAFVFYQDRVQRVDSLGDLLFTPPIKIGSPVVISAPTEDGVMGALISFGGTTGEYHQYINGVKVDSSGALPWGDTLRIWTGNYQNDWPPLPSASIVSDYHKGCITAIGGQEISLIQDIIAVHTDSSGKNGEPIIVCRASNDQQNPVIIQEPSTQGYIVAWEDSRNGNWDIYCAYLDSLLQVGIQENGLKQKPPSTVLFPNTPNPFSGSTNIHYQLPSSGNMVFRIHNVLGQTVGTLSEGYRDAGDYAVKWDARNWRGERLPDGVYFYELRLQNENGEFREIRKAVLINNN